MPFGVSSHDDRYLNWWLPAFGSDHSKTKARSPQTNGLCERFNRTIQDEFYAIAFRKRIYSTLEQIQEDLDTWINEYNTNRTHTGKYCFDRTPLQTFEETLHLAKEKQLDDLQPPKNLSYCRIKSELLHFIVQEQQLM